MFQPTSTQYFESLFYCFVISAFQNIIFSSLCWGINQLWKGIFMFWHVIQVFFLFNLFKKAFNHYFGCIRRKFCIFWQVMLPIMKLWNYLLVIGCCCLFFEIFRNDYKFFDNDESNVFLLWITKETGCDADPITQGRSFNNQNVLIIDCMFIRSENFVGHGGVIYLSGGLYSLSIISAVFSYCKSSYSSGAIYSDSLESRIENICAFQCSSNLYHFASLKSINDNHIYFLSMSYCASECNGSRSMRFYSGNQIIENTNCSLNKAKSASGIFFNKPISFQCSYCTFSSNRVLENQCIYFYDFIGTMSYSNIVDNDSPLSNGVIYMDRGSTCLENCILSMNSNTLFNLVSGTLTLVDCFISHLDLFSESKEIITSNNNNFVLIQTLLIDFFSTNQCPTDESNTDNPSLEQTLIETPILTPNPSLEQTLIETPILTPNPSLEQTLIETPILTPNPSLEQTLIETPILTPNPSLEQTLIETPILTPNPSLEQTLIETLILTPNPSLEQTLIETPILTPNPSLEQTLIKTLSETQNNNQNQQSIASTVMKTIFIICGIIGIVFGISIMIITQLKTSEYSISDDSCYEI